MEIIGTWLNEHIFLPAIRFCLEVFLDAFNTSLGILQTEAAKTPMAFSASIVSTLRTISNNVCVPIAGLILTYVFVYELITMITEKNNMAEFDVSGLFTLIFKTMISILLVTNCFPITLAIFDVGQALVNGAIGHRPPTLTMASVFTALQTDIGSDFGKGLIVMLFSFLAMLIGFIACALIYLVAWSRIITILIYISVAPIPFSTFMGKDWIGQIGQNYLKNLMALALQGFLMLVCMIIYGGLVTAVAGTIAAQGALMGIVLLLVCMFVCVKSLMSCLSLAKSIFGAM